MALRTHLCLCLLLGAVGLREPEPWRLNINEYEYPSTVVSELEYGRTRWPEYSY